MTNAIMLYVELDGQIWAIMKDGSWLALQGEIPSAIEVPFVRNLEDILTLNATGELTFNFKDKEIVVDQAELDSAPTIDNAAYQSNHNGTPSVEESSGSLGVTTRLESDGAEIIAKAGYQTTGVSTDDDVSETDESNLPPSLQKDAAITILIEDGEDSTINQFEINTVLIHGTTEQVDDRVVAVTVTDHLGNSLEFSTSVIGNTWTLGEVDLETLDQGSITAEAIITDFYENSISANTDSAIDTIAEITLILEGNWDDWLNASEVSAVSGQGTVTNVEDGDEVTITATDGAGNTAFTTVTVVGGEYSFNDLVLSDFIEGPFTAIATVTDNAGNPAEASDSLSIDTLASITIDVDSGADNTLNAAEVTQTPISGTVTNVEDGQTVTVDVTDGVNVLSFYVVINNGEWSLASEDLSSLAEGDLMFTASVSDQAGNPATATTDVIKDTLASITFTIEDGGDGWLNAAEVLNASGFGTVTNVENGQEVSITATDSLGETATVTAIVTNGEFSVSGLNLRHFADGDFTVIASVNDVAGNPATATDQVTIDTTAVISLNIETNGDGVLNTEEVGTTRLSGTTVDVDATEVVTIVVTDSLGVSLTFTTQVIGNVYIVNAADLSSLAEGELTATASVVDISGNPASVTASALKDTLADITLALEGNGDDWLSAAEVSMVAGQGTLSNVENGRLVTITATDSAGNTASTTARVLDGEYGFSDLDLSHFVEGPFTTVATVTDNAGNPAQATDSLSIDTLASITIDVDSGTDNTLNAIEVTQTPISGTVTNIEDGQTVTVEATDGVNLLSFYVVVNNGEWSLASEDLSSLAEGEITFTASVSDQAGNPAEAMTEVIKDTLAFITFTIEDGGDGWLNAAEVLSATGYGVVTNVEDGQEVTITATDSLGETATVTAIVMNGQFSVAGLDISHFPDGEFTVVASVNDIAGNPATATDQVTIDTTAVISLNIETNRDGVINAQEVGTTRLSGSTVDVDSNETVTIVVTDSLGATLTFTTQTIGNLYVVNAADLSSLAEGELTAIASVVDISGNPAEVSASALKDTMAEMTLTLEGNGDDALNISEVSTASGLGTVTNVEDGNVVTITFTDSANNTVEITTTVTNGQYDFTDADLSGFVEGQFTAVATVTDNAGNPAQANDSLTIDTLASITIDVDSGTDNTLNAVEVPQTPMSGTVINVEDGQTVTVEVTDGIDVLSFYVAVSDGKWSLASEDLSSLAEGDLTFTASVSDQAGNPAEATTDVIKDTLASITFNIEDGGDGWLNATEVISASGYGVVTNVEDGQEVTITATDSLGETASVTAIVENGVFSVSGLNLGNFVDGDFNVIASVSDVAGNIATASDEVTIDTVAAISLNINTNGDGVINAVEVDSTRLSGSTVDVDNNEIVTIVVTDSLGATLTFTTQVIGNVYIINDADLSSLAEGELTATASVTDMSGNPAEVSATALKDTLASVTIDVDSGDDNIINAAEVTQTPISGTVTNIEDGQIVTIDVTDGRDSLSFETVVANGKWSLASEDLSSLAEGDLTFTASVSDIAGNPAEATTDVIKDTLASITFTIEDGGDGWLNAQEVLSASGSGDTTNVEDGQVVTITAFDSTGQTATVTAIVTNGVFSVSGLDLSAFSNGDFTVKATVSDIAGNVATATDTVIIDTQASLTLSIESNGDGVLNAVEVVGTKLSGYTDDVDDGEIVTINVTDYAGNSLSFTAEVTAGYYEVSAADLSTLDEGQLTAVASVTDLHGNTAEVTADVIKDTLAEITLTLEGNGDDWLNAQEVMSVSGQGTVANVEDGHLVTITATDSDANTVVFTATVAGGQYSFSDVDLSSLVDGEFTAVATVTDNAGNPASAEDSLSIDTQAEITLIIESGSDDTLNQVEVVTTTFTGTTNDVENGATVFINITDSEGKSLVFTTTVSNNTYSISGVDLSSLAEGELVAIASVNDDVGNSVSATDSAIKDTLASLTIDIDSGSDITLNAAESLSTHIFGTVSNIENGQTVTVSVTDGTTTLTFDSLIAAGSWSVDSADLSTLNEGELTFTANAADEAGNPSEATANKLKDTLAEVTINLEQEGNDGVLSADESTNERIYGTVTNIENGQYATITVTDSNNTSLQFSAQVILGVWTVPNSDLSSLVDGELTAVVSVSDQAGNMVTDTATITKDTTATITVAIETNGDDVINSDEVTAVAINGTTTGVENGQLVELTITDINGQTISPNPTATVTDGVWSLVTDIDLSSFTEGEFTVVANTVDQAGNTATNSATATKDVLADTTININDQGDGVLNSIEIVESTVSGNVQYIENGQAVDVVITDINGLSILTSTTVIDGKWVTDELDLSTLAEGELSAVATITDQAGNTTTAEDTVLKDTTAQLTVSIASSGDGILNATELNPVSVFGNVTGVEVGQTVSFTLSDGTTTTGPFTAQVLIGGVWARTDMDFSVFNEGDVTASASVSDISGNPYTATAEVIKDTLASITIDIKTESDVSDDFINKVESTQTEISGTVANIEDGQIVTVIVTDGAGGELTFTTAVSGGTWSLPSTDLSTLADGIDNINAVASVVDVAGNPASENDTVSKDTLASIDVEINSGDDELLNSTEINTVPITGTVANVEDGQTVTLTITDQSNNQVVVTAEVIGGTFAISPDVDLSGFDDGQIEVVAEVLDDVGNVATATDDATKDTQVSIDIDTDTNNGFDSPYVGFNAKAFMEGTHDSVGGSTTAEAGQTVTLTVTDGTDSVDFTTTVDSDGRWLVDNIDIASLDNTQVWNVSAAVNDLAGNSASDEMPSLNILDSISFSEENLNSSAVSGDIAIGMTTDNTEFAFTQSQPQLSSITSEGSSVFSLVAADGLVIEVFRESDGALVFNAVIDSNGGGSVHISMFEPVDHALGSDSLITQLFIKAIQTDDDGTTEGVNMPLNFEIIDSSPEAGVDGYKVVEATTTSDGNLLSNDTAVDGDPLVNSVTFGGVTQSVSAGQDATFDTGKGQLQVSYDGSWSFVAAHNLDNTQEQTITFDYEIIDLDGDVDSTSVIITIVDGEKGSMDAQFEEHIEPDVTEVTSFVRTFTINAGSDDLVADTISFSDGTLTILNELDLTSNGEEITFTINADNTLITANSADGTVFTLTLSAVNNDADLTGSLNFEQNLPLDHISADDLTIRVGVFAQDSDGTNTTPNSVDWTIFDGNDARIQNTQDIAINEADLSAGPVQGSGTLKVTPGSDNTVSIAFDVTKQPSLTAGGETIEYRLNGDVLEGYTGTAPSDVLVFEVALTGTLAAQAASNMGYEITLHTAIDQIDGSGNNIDTLVVPFVVTVTDGDNDITDQSLVINITDSGEAIITGDGFKVTETPSAPTTPSAITASDDTVITITANKDPITSLTLDVSTADSVTLSDGTAVTQHGEAVVWQDNGDGNYKGVLADGTVVFTLVLPETLYIEAGDVQDVTLALNLIGPIDHDKTLYDNILEIALPLVATDSDNSTLAYDITASVTDGELPSLDLTDQIYLDENQLLIGADKDAKDYTLIEGSDEVVSVEPILAGQVIPGVTSNGETVSFGNSANDNGWWVAKTDDNTAVFKVRFNLDGTIDAQLLSVVDHPGVDQADTLSITLDIQAIDADGDVTADGANQVTINILDDVPDQNNATLVIEEGLTKDLDLLSNNEAGADGGEITRVKVGNIAYEAGEVITLTLSDGTEYGTLQINSDGSGQLITFPSIPAGIAIIDEIVYTVVDGDGDLVDNLVLLDIADELGEITITDTSFIEDTPETLALKVYVGDEDNNEAIEQVIFDADSLLGGTLTFEGALLSTNADGDYILDGANFVIGTSGSYVPDGDLIFTPLLNSSDQTQSVSLIISAVVSKDSLADQTITTTIPISVTSDADAPIWDEADSTFEYTLLEDADQQSISINADLFDTDSSEVLTYLVGDIDTGLTLTVSGAQVVAGDVLSADQVALIKVAIAPNIAGAFEFDITPIATEIDNNDSESGDVKTIVINVQPVADKPKLAVFEVKGDEDEIILLKDAINGQLTDTDGSESLSYLITVPDGWSVVTIDGSSAIVTDNGNGVYSVTDADVEAGEVGLLPAPHVSSVTGTYEVTAQAVSTESTQDGQVPNPTTNTSDALTFEVVVKGVVDAPIVEAGGDWTFDNTTQTIVNSVEILEDQLISLDIAITTPDQDGSENINLLLSNIPTGFEFTDSNGDSIALNIVEFDGNSNPIYQVTLAELEDLYLKPVSDYSGQISFNINAVITEADGDAKPDGIAGSLPDDSLFALKVEINITPVIDSTPSAVNIVDDGVEDTLTQLYLLPNTGQDSDGSEVVTAFSIASLDSGLTLYFDGAEITAPVDVADYIDASNSTLASLLNSGRFDIQSPTDASGTFHYTVEYTITDTSDSGEVTTESFTDQASIVISAEVEDLSSPDNDELSDTTRLEASKVAQVSENGEVIGLDGLVQFYDQDDDGSEYIDYIVIQVPNEAGWIVSHPNYTVIDDGDGRWVIDVSGLTSDSVMENGLDLLAGVTVYSNTASLISKTVQVFAHVNDGDDKEMIETTLQVHFKADGPDTTASAIDDLQIDYIQGDEDNAIDIGSQINLDLTDDSNDILSFKILVSDLPYGSQISGADVIADYDSSGKVVVEYLFTEASLSTLVLSGITPDFAGTFELPITTIATDSDSGDTLVDSQILQFEINPIVDGLSPTPNVNEILEDTLTLLDLSATFNDSNLFNQGIESLAGLTFTLVDGGMMTAGDGVLTEISLGVYRVDDLTQLSTIAYQGPLNVSGEVNINFSAEIIDTANGYNGDLTATDTVDSFITVDITPVTDSVTITTENSQGDEDTYISLSDLSVEFIDADGSETMSIELTGLPAGAVLVYGTPGNYITLPDNGVDGGSFNGEPTYKWSVEQSQFDSLAILPPLDFSGDIPLAISVIGYEIGTQDYVTSEGSFVLEINPIADETAFTSVPEAMTGEEGQVTEFALEGFTTETDTYDATSAETLILSVKVDVGSDSSAFLGLDRIRVGNTEGQFVLVGGYAIAQIEIDSNELDGFELLTGPYAFGHFELEIGLTSKDSATVGGQLVENIGETTTVTTTLDLTAVVDQPILTLDVDSIFTEVNTSTPLPIDLTLINADVPDEVGYVEITGVPAGASISLATESDGVWTLQQADIENATLDNLTVEGEFDLVITPFATLEGESATNSSQTLELNVSADTDTITGDFYDNLIVGSAGNEQIIGGLGDDQLFGGAGQDNFVFNDADQGSVAKPASDTINDFEVGADSVDVTELYTAFGNGGLDSFIDLTESAGNTILEIKTSGGDVTQQITIENTSVDDLYGSDSSAVSEADILSKLIDDNTLITGQA